jgi:signal transduction histidine kinase
LKVETTICDEVRQSEEAVVIDDVGTDETYSGHPTPAMYGFRSYISVPIMLPDGSFFGTLCAIDPRPARLKNAQTIGMFRLFAELIAFHIDAQVQVSASNAALLGERKTAELREQFIAVLGHDLRNPLAAISGGAELLQREALTEKALQLVTLIQRSAARIGGLIDDVMDFARGQLGGGLILDAKGMEPLAPVLHQVIAELRANAPDRVIETAIELDAPVLCDRPRIAQLLSNLLGNAMTYGAPGLPIRVRAGTEAGWFELSVSNSGEPIPPSALDRLFQPFTRGAGQPNQLGLGLGLFIASQIAKAHGGTLTVASTAEETRFTFRMPLGSCRVG